MAARRDVTAPVQGSADIGQAHSQDVHLAERPVAPEIVARLAGHRLALQLPERQPQAVVPQGMSDGLARCRGQPAVPEL